MKYFKAKGTGSIFRTVFQGENYVHGVIKDKPATWGYSASYVLADVEEWSDEPKVGDTVRLKDKPRDYDKNRYLSGQGTATLIHIHQAPGDNRKFAVVAFKGDIPKSLWYDSIEKNE